MRFAQLQLIRYGRFEDCSLTFPAGDCDLQLILGPNEAGKSTILSAVGDLLFSFPPRTRFAFRFDQKLLRVGAVLEREGTSLEVRRRKGNVDTLLDADDQPIDAAGFSAHLDGQTRESFERMFGLDHARLRDGGKAILDNRDDVGAAIFAAGSGLVQVARVWEALDSEAKEIWAKNAGESRRYNAAYAAYQAARAKLREVEVRPNAWTKARKELEAAEKALEEVRAERAILLQRRRKVQRQQLVLPPSVRRQEALEKLKELGGTPELSADAARRCGTALDEAQTSRTEIDFARSDVELLQSDLNEAQTSPELLAIAPEVDALRELKGVVDQGAAEVAGLKARRESGWTRIAAAVAEIGWPAEAPGSLKVRLPGRLAVAELRDLLERRRVLEEQARAAEDAVREAQATKTRLQDRIAALPAILDLRSLQDLARDLRAAGHVQALQQAEKTTQELEQMLAQRLRALGPWTGDVAALRALAAPSDEDVDATLDRLQEAQDRLVGETEACDREAVRLAQLQLDRKQTVLAHPAATRADLDTARQARDTAWAPLKSHLNGEKQLADSVSGVRNYEGAVIESDQLADERFAAAEHAGGLAALEREVEKCELLLTQAQARRAAAESALAAAQDAFRSLLAPLGVPLSPDAYPPWRDARSDACQAADALDLARQDLGRAQAAEAAGCEALAAGLETPGRTAAAGFQTLLAEADRKVEAATEARANERELQGQLNAAKEAFERARGQAETAAAADAKWTAGWAPAMLRGGLDANASAPVARAQLEIIETLRGDVDTLLDLDAELDAIAQSEGAFATRVISAAQVAGLAVDRDPAQLYAELRAAVTTAAATAERFRALEASLKLAHNKIREGEARLATSEVAFAPLRASLPEGDAAALRELLVRATEAGRLRAQVQETEAEILKSGDSRGLQALLDEVAEADVEELAVEAEDLDGELERLNDDFGAKSESRQAAKLGFDALDDRPDAAIAAFEMEQARSEMAFQAELYIRKRAEARLLRAAVERYRQEKQGPLLTRASKLFATLTLERFSGLIVDYDDDKPKLAGVRSDGATVVPVDGMSDGTVDQLFLALRIAAVEDLVAQGVRLPFVADDLFINFDDERAAAGFKVLAELARKTQVLFFTHHSHLASVATAALRPAKVAVCELLRDAGLQEAPEIIAAE